MRSNAAILRLLMLLCAHSCCLAPRCVDQQLRDRRRQGLSGRLFEVGESRHGINLEAVPFILLGPSQVDTRQRQIQVAGERLAALRNRLWQCRRTELDRFAPCNARSQSA